MMEKLNPPRKWIKYEGHGLAFDYPEGGTIYEFHHSDGTVMVRLAGLVAGKAVQIDIEKWSHADSAQAACEAIYKSSSELLPNESVAPKKVKVGNSEGWRCIRRLVDGSIISDYTDTTFLTAAGNLYRVELVCGPESYNKTRNILDAVLKTIQIN